MANGPEAGSRSYAVACVPIMVGIMVPIMVGIMVVIGVVIRVARHRREIARNGSLRDAGIAEAYLGDVGTR
jgi:hypothetical protein